LHVAGKQVNLQLLVRNIVCNQTYGNATTIATFTTSSLVSDDEVLPAKVAGGEEITC